MDFKNVIFIHFMLTRSGLLELLNKGENSEIAFKPGGLQSHDLANELVALSNFNGGRVVLGVEEHNAISGITRKNLEAWVIKTCRDKIRPAIMPFFAVVRDIAPGKEVAIISVVRGFDVHSVWHNNRNAYYIRVGTQSREASSEKLRRLLHLRGNLRAELQTVYRTKLADFDRRRLRNYFTHIRQQ